MHIQIPEQLKRVLIIDISGLYAQIYDQGYFNPEEYKTIKETYNDMASWCIVALPN